MLRTSRGRMLGEPGWRHLGLKPPRDQPQLDLLREAEFWGLGQEEASGATALGGQHLGPLGSRIVAETFVGLLWRDANSYLRRHPKFKPHATVSGGADHFKLAHLFKYALS